MTSSQIVREVERLVRPVAEQAGLELWDVEFANENNRWYLRIFIDKPGGVDHEDCRFVSEKIDPLLDEEVPVGHSYTLEVSSPGVERPLKKVTDFERYLGSEIRVTTFANVNGRKKNEGRLTGVDPDGVLVVIDDKPVAIPFKQIVSARLKVVFS